MASLFEDYKGYRPLAARVRPLTLSDYIGQSHLIGQGRPLSTALGRGALHSMIFWGPPGVGKTTFAHLMAEQFDVLFKPLSAVLSGVKDIRQAIEEAKILKAQRNKDTLLFIDEVHRFNKSQQDAFLPYVEDGSIIFVGATTENPSFELNNALLSRARVYVLKPLSKDEIKNVITRALHHPEGFPGITVSIGDDLIDIIGEASYGDARKALNIFELAVDLSEDSNGRRVVSRSALEEVMQSSLKRFDKGGDVFYEQISALHKSVRGSDPDAALYWFMRMIEAGCDPLYVARRVVRMASEDIGNADPRALQLALNAWDVQERLGSPEGELTLAQAIIYLSVAPKSNAVYKAFNECRNLVRSGYDHEVPMHLRNAPTKLMKEQGMGQEYRYAHDESEAFAAGECYLPAELKDTDFYHPVDRGLEQRIRDKLAKLKALNMQSNWQRYD